MNTVLPGDLTSDKAGPLLRRGAPVRGPSSQAGPFDIVTHEPNGTHCMTVFEGLVEQARIALDLTDPAGMDLAARWLARHHGLTVGATATEWRREMSHYEGEPTCSWALCVRARWAHDKWVCFHSEEEDADGANAWVLIPGISAITDPAEALRLACLHAGGRS